ncbi:MAG: PQQ-binding-like beta-propeller repeat protein [Gemmataceae bacterium]
MLWALSWPGLSTIKSPAAGDGQVFVAGEKLIALRPNRNGGEPAEEWQGGTPAQGYASPVYHQGRVYYLTAVALVCLDAATGEDRWRQRVDGPFDASPLVADGRLYAVNNRGRTTVVQLGDRPKVLARNDLADRLQATPALSGQCLFLRSEKWLYCVGPCR